MRSRQAGALVIAAVLFGAAGCGGTDRGTSSVRHASTATLHRAGSVSASVPAAPTSRATSRPVASDNDADGDGGADDIGWGNAARPADQRAVVALVRHYYALAAAEDGAGACALIYSIFAEEIPEVYGAPPGEPAVRGPTCAVVMSKLFRLRHRQLAGDIAKLKVSRVRVKGLRGLAFLNLGALSEHDIPVHLEHGVWRIDALLDGGLG
jgi:hypothetical protein